MTGFLPFSRASFMLDFVFIAMILAIPVLIYSIYVVKVKRNFQLHKRIQIVLSAVLLVAVLLFEGDMRINGWVHMAKPSRFFDSLVYPILYIHLVFAITTLFLWIAVIIGALKNFAKPPTTSDYSPTHKKLGKLAAYDMMMTSLTGWMFFVVAFCC